MSTLTIPAEPARPGPGSAPIGLELAPPSASGEAPVPPSYVPRRHQWTLEEYGLMSDQGLLRERRTELIDGEIIDLAAQNDPHRLAVSKAFQAFLSVFDPSSYWTTSQSTIRLSALQAPEPDVAVERPQPLSPGKNMLVHPLIVVEISDVTLLYDQFVKGSLYAAHKIEDYWIINVNDRQVEVYCNPVEDPTRPHGWRYGSLNVYRPPDFVSPLAKPEAIIEVAKLLL